MTDIIIDDTFRLLKPYVIVSNLRQIIIEVLSNGLIPLSKDDYWYNYKVNSFIERLFNKLKPYSNNPDRIKQALYEYYGIKNSILDTDYVDTGCLFCGNECEEKLCNICTFRSISHLMGNEDDPLKLMTESWTRNRRQMAQWIMNNFKPSKCDVLNQIPLICGTTGSIEFLDFLNSYYKFTSDDFRSKSAFRIACNAGNYPVAEWIYNNMGLVAADCAGIEITYRPGMDRRILIDWLDDVYKYFQSEESIPLSDTQI